MNEALTPKQLAAIKRDARKARIRLIRQRVAISVATVSAVFSGLILVRSLDQTGAVSKNTTSLASNRVATTDDDGQTTLIFPDESSTSVPTTTAPATSAPAPAPTAPPLVTSQS